MQILDYDGDDQLHVCLNCDTEFTVSIVNVDVEEEMGVLFCPCCGAPLQDEIDEDELLDEIDLDDEDKYC